MSDVEKIYSGLSALFHDLDASIHQIKSLIDDVSRELGIEA